MMETKTDYTYVHLSSNTNSTMFTNCCGSAVTNRDIKCPSCGATVYGADVPNEHERGQLRWKYAFKSNN